MRTDMKIGILVGLVIALGVVAYLFYNNMNGTEEPVQSTSTEENPDQTQQPEGQASARATDTDQPQRNVFHSDWRRGASYSRDDTDTDTTASGDAQGVQEDAATVAAGGTEASDATSPGTFSEQSFRAQGASQLSALAVVEPIDSQGDSSSSDGDTGQAAARFGSADSYRSFRDSDDSTQPATFSATQVYTVQEGDTLGAISQRFYGSSSHWPVIQEANGGVEPTTLRVGMDLTIPPLPADRQAGSSSTTVARNDLPAGSRTHVVAEDETITAIARQYYGEGARIQPILNANNINENDLIQIGQELIIPAAGSSGTSSSTGTSSTPTVPPGYRTYTVGEGDRGGFWSIAEAVYGNGAKWYLIQEANPGVGHNRLRPGMVLLIPPMDAQGGSSPSGSSATTNNNESRRTTPRFTEFAGARTNN